MVKAAEDDQGHLERLRRSAKTSESVIQWLNRQLTAAKVRHPDLRVGPPPKNLTGDDLMVGTAGTTALTSMQPSMATEHRNNMLVASTPIQVRARQKTMI